LWQAAPAITSPAAAAIVIDLIIVTIANSGVSVRAAPDERRTKAGFGPNAGGTSIDA
jgi:hypothetical protein